MHGMRHRLNLTLAMGLALPGCQGAGREAIDASGPDGAVAAMPEVGIAPYARRIDVFPVEPRVRPGSSLQLVAHVGNGHVNQLTWWSLLEESCGSLVAAGNAVRYTAPAAPRVCTVRGTSVVFGDLVADTRITVTDAVGPELLIFPGGPDDQGLKYGAPMGTGPPQSYMVVEDLAAASPVVAVEWSFLRTWRGVMPLPGGTIATDDRGNLAFIVKAADGRATAIRVFIGETVGNVAITPPAATVAPGATLQLSATPPGLAWRVTGPPGATISPTGLFTAPASAGVWGVVASSPGGTPSGATTIVVR